jgi:hypothetical protein
LPITKLVKISRASFLLIINILLSNFLILLNVLRSQFIYFIDKSLVLTLVSLHINLRFFFKVVQVFLVNVLPNATHFLHYIERCDLGVVLDNFGSCLNVI